MLLSIIIINYNVKYFLEQCLLSVCKAAAGLQVEISVVDNASTDGSFDFFQDKFPEVSFTWNRENIGFARANNMALREARGRYILFLNPDTIVPEDCFEKCVAFLNSQKNPSALGVKMIDGSGKFLPESKRSFPSPAASFYKLSGLARVFPKSTTFGKYYLKNLSDEKNEEVEVLSGAFMMVSKEILDITGGFDEKFFMYGEDIDLSYRIMHSGFRNYFFADTSIIHFKGESTQRASVEYATTFYEAMEIFVKKHFAGKRSFSFYAILRLSILFAKATAISRRKLQLRKHQRSSALPRLIVIAGRKEEEAKLAKLCNANGNHIHFLDASTAEIEKLVVELRRLQIEKKCNEVHVIFCQGPLTFSEIIYLFTVSPPSFHLQIFSNGSHAIIGSSDKNSRGHVVKLDDQSRAK